MFENTPPPPADGLGAAPIPPPPDQAGPLAVGQDLHTMPERFFSSSEPAATGGKGIGRGLKITLMVVIAVAVVGVGGYFAYTQLIAKPSNENANTNTLANRNQNVNRNTNGASNVNIVVNINAPTNGNTNANSNVNATNGNVNANANLNTNANANLNANVNANTNTNANTNVNASTNTSPIASSQDTDGDGLTDIEEALYGTGVNVPDTDKDGFIDGKQKTADGKYVGEIYLGYDPTQAGKRLTENAAIVTAFTNNTYLYRVYYPTKWTARATDGERTLVISSDGATGEYFQIIVADNPSKLTAAQWYTSVNPSSGTAETFSVNGLDAARSPDLNTVYFAKNDRIYTLSYVLGTLSTANYRTTFDVLIQNFGLIAASSGSVTTPASGT